jgi:hypothetical protein
MKTKYITYMYPDGTNDKGKAKYRVDFRPVHQRVGFSEICENKDSALILTSRIINNPEQYMR